MQKIIQRVFYIITLAFLSNGIIANTIVPFEFVNGLIVIKAELDGEVGNYILDSGSNGILLNSKSESSTVSYQTLSGVAEGSELVINSLKLGNIESKKLLGFSTDLSNLELYIDKSLAGILGSTVFTTKSIEINFLTKKLIISDSEIETRLTNGLNVMNYNLVDDLPVAELTINGEKKSFIIDTGASCHFIDSKVLAGLGNKCVETGVKKNILSASGKNSISEEYIIPNVVSEQTNIIKVFSKDFSLLSDELGKDIHGLISLSKLSDSVIYFDVVNKKVYF